MRSAELADDHKGNDQTVKADTFCKTDVNQGLTEDALVLTDRSQRRGSCGGDSDTAAKAGNAGRERSRNVAEPVLKSGVNRLTASIVLKRPRFFSPSINAVPGTRMLRISATNSKIWIVSVMVTSS